MGFWGTEWISQGLEWVSQGNRIDFWKEYVFSLQCAVQHAWYPPLFSLLSLLAVPPCLTPLSVLFNWLHWLNCGAAESPCSVHSYSNPVVAVCFSACFRLCQPSISVREEKESYLLHRQAAAYATGIRRAVASCTTRGLNAGPDCCRLRTRFRFIDMSCGLMEQSVSQRLRRLCVRNHNHERRVSISKTESERESGQGKIKGKWKGW